MTNQNRRTHTGETNKQLVHKKQKFDNKKQNKKTPSKAEATRISEIVGAYLCTKQYLVFQI